MQKALSLMVALFMIAIFTMPAKGAADGLPNITKVQALAMDTTTTTMATTVPAPNETYLTPPLVIDEALVKYILVNTPPDELIRYYFSDQPQPVIDRMLYIACREGGMGKDRVNPKPNPCASGNRVPAVAFDPSCGADNPSSSATGLFQFMGSWRGWGGYDWSKIVSRDCLEDVQMARAVFAENGFDPWN